MTDVTSSTSSETLRRAVMRLSAIARNGLTFSQDPFDIERFHEVAEIGHELSALVYADTPPEFDARLESLAGYTTPKVDVRGAVFNEEGAVLLVREKADGGWSMPGGWCDILETPREAVAREVLEETGLPVHVLRLAALLDRERWGHEPPFDAHVYKVFFLCAPQGSVEVARAADEREISDVGWFSVDRLPNLSSSRLTSKQVELAHARWCDPSLPTAFD
ncbi:MAG: NUDIX hydrolase N-terminal domain-containing protein [Nocardioidaceae bacterium]